MLEKLSKTAESENYFKNIEFEFNELSKKIEEQKKEDVLAYEEEIRLILENEIVSRYYYQTGRIQASLATDKDVLKAIDICTNKLQYDSILTPTIAN